VLLWPFAYWIAAAVVVSVSILGYLVPVLAGQPATMEGVFTWVAVATAFVTPVLTLPIRAERRSSARIWELVTARWLAGLVLFLATIAFTLSYVALLALYQPRVDFGAILTGYLGIVLVGATWVALALLAANIVRNPLAALVAGIATLLALQYGVGTAAGFLSPPLSDLLDYASAANRAQSFERGQVVLHDVVYFVSLTAGALVLTARVLAARRRP
jgi:ABC-2 type transport system permease protein